MITIGEPVATVTRYDVSCLPADDANRRHAVVPVTRTTRGTWRVGADYDWFNAARAPSRTPIELDLDPALAAAHADRARNQ